MSLRLVLFCSLFVACGTPSSSGGGGGEPETTCTDDICPEVCDDGQDNDGNGLSDCDDPACAASCSTTEDCFDGRDNDGDGASDCSDSDCDTTCDRDGDGWKNWQAGGNDCDDDNPEVNPSITEVCDGLDNDCNGWVDADDEGLDRNTITRWYLDYDGDGYGDPAVNEWNCFQPPGMVDNRDDCNDADPNHNPDTPEICNNYDDNCDGLVDDADPLIDLTTAGTHYADTDGDGLGDPNSTTEACSSPTGFVSNSDDCDDTRSEVLGPSGWVPDLDGDGYGLGTSTGTVSCTPPGTGYAQDYLPQDCDESNNMVYPGAYEYCGDYEDWDCDGQDCAEFTDDFESGSIGSEWVLSGNANWFAQTSMFYAGSWGAECGNINDNQTSDIEVTLDFPAGGDATFWHSGDTESGWDFLRFYIDGVQQAEWSGSWGWTFASYPVSTGVHTLRWTYYKDGSVSTGQDTVWIDEVVVPGGVY